MVNEASTGTQQIDTDAVASFVDRQLGQGAADAGMAVCIGTANSPRGAEGGAQNFAAVGRKYDGGAWRGFAGADLQVDVHLQCAAVAVAVQFLTDDAIQKCLTALSAVGITGTRDMFDTTLLEEL